MSCGGNYDYDDDDRVGPAVHFTASRELPYVKHQLPDSIYENELKGSLKFENDPGWVKAWSNCVVVQNVYVVIQQCGP